VTSDVQFRKGALIPPVWVGLGWADLQQVLGGWGECRDRGDILIFYLGEETK
jgi:hypothetical protein